MFALIFLLTAAAATPPRPNACQVLSARDVERVQGQPFKSVKLTETDANGLKVSQCFYALPAFANSVSVDVMRGRTTDFWRSHFRNAVEARDEDEDRERETQPASRNEEHETAAKKIGGVGDAAVWSGSRVAGALYVLRGDVIVRVSVGGAGSEEQKIERSKKLAARALRKL
jgi:hypothetical protein